MKHVLILVWLLPLTIVGQPAAIGKIEHYDKTAGALIDTDAVIEVLGSHYQWAEGPVWAASGNRQLVRMNAPLSSPRPDFTVLAANYHGKKFNSPNDVVVDKRNTIYFTDPIYGLPGKEKDPTRELPFEGVYRIDKSGQLTLLIDSIARPNGIALSPDEKTLYVGSSDDPHTRWYAYQLDSSGKITGGGILLDGTSLKAHATVKQGADGFKVDDHGNIWSAGPDGINIISPGGKLLGLIRIYHRRVSNCAFNSEKNVLYITATDLLLRVKLK